MISNFSISTVCYVAPTKAKEIRFWDNAVCGRGPNQERKQRAVIYKRLSTSKGDEKLNLYALARSFSLMNKQQDRGLNYTP